MGDGEFLEFVEITPTDWYPVLVSDTDLTDDDGEPEGAQVCHDRSFIVVSPDLNSAERKVAIAEATRLARQTYCLRDLELPFAGDVE